MSDLAARLAQAQELIGGMHLDAASSLVEDAARESPDNPWPPLLGAKIAFLRRELARSREMLSLALGLGADHPGLQFTAYLMLCEWGRDAEACRLLQDARSRFPGDVPLLREDALRASASGDWSRAYALWSELAERMPDSSEALFEVSRSLEHLPGLDRRIVAVYGNCQAAHLALLCGLVPALTRRYRFVPVTNNGFRNRPRPPIPGEVGNAELVWEQFDQSASVDVRDRMRERLPRDILCVRYPGVTLTALWPFACVDRRPGRVHEDRPAFGDRIALEIAALGLAPEQVFERYMKRSREKMPDVGVLLERDRAVQQKRDEASEVKIADFIFANLRREHQFYGWGYPTAAVIAQIILQLVEASRLEGVGERLEEQLRTACRMAPSQVPAQLPLHPDVIRALRIEYVDADSKYSWYEHRWTFEEYMTRYITLDPQW